MTHRQHVILFKFVTAFILVAATLSYKNQRHFTNQKQADSAHYEYKK